MQKKGVEMSINLFVALVIGIIVFIFGIIFARQLFSAAMEKQKQIDQSTEEQIRSLLSQGQKIAIPVNRKTIEPGAADAFGLGILNVDTTGNNNFYVYVTPGYAYAEDGSQIFPNPLKILIRGEDFQIQTNKEEIISVGVKVPSSPLPQSGTYIIDVKVCHDNDPLAPSPTEDSVNCNSLPGMELYDSSVHKLYVEVT